MLKFGMGKKDDAPLRILCIGAHSDDIEIGCGGTLLHLLSAYEDVEVDWVVLGAKGKRKAEAVASANKFLATARKKNLHVNNFQDGYFPYIGGKIKNYFEQLKTRISPDMIFTHSRDDLHQDHRLVAELTWNTFRDHLILEYEIIKYDGDIGVPNFYVPLDAATCRKKIELIMDSFQTQRGKDWFTADALLSVMRIRGIESKAPGNHAEGFYCRKIILSAKRHDVHRKA